MSTLVSNKLQSAPVLGFLNTFDLRKKAVVAKVLTGEQRY